MGVCWVSLLIIGLVMAACSPSLTFLSDNRDGRLRTTGVPLGEFEGKKEYEKVES